MREQDVSGSVHTDNMAKGDVQSVAGPTAPALVVGIGGGGCNAVSRMISAGLSGVEFLAINTDRGGLARSLAPTKVVVGDVLPNGHDSGGDPEVGRDAARSAASSIEAYLRRRDLVVLVVGEGGGTGSGGAPIVAQIARSTGARVAAVVTRPLTIEGHRRGQTADDAIERLRREVDELVVVPLDSLLAHTAKSKMTTVFDIADLILLGHAESFVRPPGVQIAHV